MDGILNLYKPRGVTSHDMVYLVRRAAGERKVGHTGTLDPEAEGVLPILIGKATRLSDLLTADDKAYTATVQLGVTTDSYDMAGQITSRCDMLPGEQAVREAAQSFVGDILQTPPMYSAIKKDGRPLYKLARQGVTLELEPRRVRIDSVQVYAFDASAGTFRMDVACSKGTYIRSLCHDLGQKLGCGAAMAGLVRTRSGLFCVEDSIPAETVRSMQPDELEKQLLSLDTPFLQLPRLDVAGDMERKVRNGLRMRPDQYGLTSAAPGTHFRIYGADGRLLLVAEAAEVDGNMVLRQIRGFF